MLDEIHLKPAFYYKRGKICGMTYNNTLPASGAHVFMIKSLLSSFQNVIHILPSGTLKAEELHAYIKKVIVGFEKIGFVVIGLVTNYKNQFLFLQILQK